MTAVIPFVPSFCRENGEMLQYWYLKKAKKIVTTQILEIQSMHLQMESDLKKKVNLHSFNWVLSTVFI